jgi:hypothetical protein
VTSRAPHFGPLCCMTAQQSAKKPLGCTLIAARLQQNIDDTTILIHGPPKILLLAVDSDEEFVQIRSINPVPPPLASLSKDQFTYRREFAPRKPTTLFDCLISVMLRRGVNRESFSSVWLPRRTAALTLRRVFTFFTLYKKDAKQYRHNRRLTAFTAEGR